MLRRRILVATAAVAAVLSSPAHADGPLPGSCKTHPNKVVNPGCVPALTGGVTDPAITLPNLVPNVVEVAVERPFEWDPETGTFYPGAPILYFDTRAQNLGTVPVQLTMNDVPDTETAPVSQCVAWTERVCRAQEEVGGFVWHAEHQHWHFEEFAAYQLRRLGADGRPDYSSAGLIALSDKVSFCMIDSAQVDPNASPAPTYNTCLPTVQGISPGWEDIYTYDLPGQSFSLDGLADGRYALVISMNYASRLHESEYGDNVLEATIEVRNGMSEVEVVDRHYP